MDASGPAFTVVTAIMLAWVAVGLILVRIITPLERRLVAGTALLLAGLVLLSRGQDPIVTTAGIGGWLMGLGIFVRAGRLWRRRNSSRVGPLAAVLVLPAAVLGAIVLMGVVVSMMAGPVRLATRLVGG